MRSDLSRDERMAAAAAVAAAAQTKMASKMACTVVVLGDARIGKTALIQRLTRDEFLETYTPTSFDKVLTVQEVNKHNVDFVLWDTSGSPAYDSIRSLSYQEADVFLLCYKISDPISLYNVKKKWLPEIRRHRQDTPIVLCGLQADLRHDQATSAALSKTGRAVVSQEQALAICCDIEALNYVETSARAGSPSDSKDIHEAFELCALAAIRRGTAPSTTSSLGSAGRPPRRSPSQNSRLGNGHGHHNASFGSQSDIGSVSGSKRSENSSLKKSSCNNVSFSGSEAELVFHQISTSSVIASPIIEDDVFPGDFLPPPPPPPPAPPMSPRLGVHFSDASERPSRRHSKRASVGGILKSPPPLTHSSKPDFIAEEALPLHTSTARSSVFIAASPPPSDPAAAAANTTPSKAQVRSNGLSRRTSFRSQQKHVASIPVASPKSPMGSVSSYDIKSPSADELGRMNLFDMKMQQQQVSAASTPMGPPPSGHVLPPKGFESLKSHVSTASQGSTGSKTSTSSSVASSVSAGPAANAASATGPNCHILDPSVPNTEDPELLNKLQFVSPKSGVFRPVNNAAAGAASPAKGGKKQKQNCNVM